MNGEKITIETVDKQGIVTTDRVISTAGYVVLYMEGDSFKVTGKMSASAIAPLLLKLMADKLGK